MSSNDPNIYMIEANSSAPIYTMYRDGTSIYSTTGNFTFEDNITALNYGGRNLKGWIAETILLDDIPSQEDRQKIEGYLAHKWDLAANLPDGHPYKNAAPESSIVGGGSGATCNIFTKPSYHQVIRIKILRHLEQVQELLVIYLLNPLTIAPVCIILETIQITMDS